MTRLRPLCSRRARCWAVCHRQLTALGPRGPALTSSPPALPQQQQHQDGGASGGCTDIRTDSWVHRWLPEAAVPYGELARWDRPIGTWLLLWPCLWSIALAAPAGSPPNAPAEMLLRALFGQQYLRLGCHTTEGMAKPQHA